MKLQIYDREVALPKTAVTAQRNLNIGTQAPKAKSNLANQLDKIGNDVFVKVKAANEMMEYSSIIADGKTQIAGFYAERRKDPANHETLVEDTNEYVKKLRVQLTKDVKNIGQKARLQQGFDQIATHFNSQAIGEANIQAIGQAKAGHVKLRESKLQEASVSSDDAMASVITNYAVETHNLASIGVLSPENTENDILAFSKEAVHGKARHLINNNPWEAKAYLEDKKSMSRVLDPVRRESLIAQAQSQINVREARQRAQGNAAKKVLDQGMKAEVSATVKQLKKGVIPQNYDDVLNAVSGTDHEQKLKAAHAVADDIAVFNGMAPDEKQIFINSVKEGGSRTGVEAETMDILEKNLEHTRRELKNGNGLELAFEQGIIDQLPPLAYDWPELLQQRKGLVLLADEHFHQKNSPITTGEASQLIGELDMMTVTGKAERFGIMVNAWGPMSKLAFEQVAKKSNGVYAISGALIVEGRKDVAIETLKGFDALKADPKIMPGDFDVTFKGLVGNAYSEGEDQEKYIRNSVRALYARMITIDGKVVADANEGDVKTALNAITGGIYKLDIETFGWNKTYKVEAPRHGVDQDEFENWMEGITADDVQDMGGTADNEEVTRLINEGKVKLITLGNGNYGVEMVDGRPIVANDGRGFILRYPEP